MKTRIIILVLIGILTVMLFPIITTAACRTIFGGGSKSNGSPYCVEEAKQPTVTPTPKQETNQFQSGIQMGNQQTTKGGLTQVQQQNTTKGGVTTVYPPTNTQQIPSTGPELLSLVILIPAGAAGFFLRRKTA